MSDTPKDDGYLDLIDNSIDDLNATGDLSGTEIKLPKKHRKLKLFRANHPLITGLFFAAIVSSGAFLFQTEQASKNALSREAADAQILSELDADSESEGAARALIEFVFSDTSASNSEQADAPLRDKRAVHNLRRDLIAAGVDSQEVEIILSTIKDAR